MNEENLMKVKPDTIARTIVLVLALINQILAILGKGTLTIAQNDTSQVCSLVCTIGAAIWSWWKNNSFTKAALVADEKLKELKSIE